MPNIKCVCKQIGLRIYRHYVLHYCFTANSLTKRKPFAVRIAKPCRWYARRCPLRLFLLSRRRRLSNRRSWYNRPCNCLTSRGDRQQTIYNDDIEGAFNYTVNFHLKLIHTSINSLPDTPESRPITVISNLWLMHRA